MTDENKEKSASQKYTEKKNAMREVIKNFLNETKIKFDPPVKEAIEFLAGVGARTRSTVNTELHDLFLQKKSISEIELFQKYKYGRPAMEQKIRYFIKLPAEKRIWIAFENDNYVIKGVGENAPRDWNGYTPVVEAEL